MDLRALLPPCSVRKGRSFLISFRYYALVPPTALSSQQSMERALSAPLRRVSETLHTTFHPSSSSRLAEVSSSSSSGSGSRSSGSTERSQSGSRSPPAPAGAGPSSPARLRRSPILHEAEQVYESLVKEGDDDDVVMTGLAGSTQGSLQRSALMAETGSSGSTPWADNEGLLDASTALRKRPRLDEAAMVSVSG